MLLEKYLDLAIRAHNGTSHVPEQRGRYYIKSYSEELAADMERVTALGGDPEDYRQRYERHFVAWLHAKSNCLSSMITGPSGFPVRRAEKANASERRRSEEFTGFRERYFARIERDRRRDARAALEPIADMERKINVAQRNQEAMKAANKIIGKKLPDAEKVAQLGATMCIPEGKALELLQPDFCGRVGFPSYLLTNNLANIKRMQGRLAELRRKAASDTRETVRPDGIRIVANVEADRLQIFFPDKPSHQAIQNLKSRGWRWSPTNGCWQRQLTQNARWSLKEVLPQE